MKIRRAGAVPSCNKRAWPNGGTNGCKPKPKRVAE